MSYKFIAVISGKGGVGKSLSAVNISYSLNALGKKVGLVDLDIVGSNIPKVLGLPKVDVKLGKDCVYPIEHAGVKVLGVANFLPNDDQPVLMKGERRRSFVQQLIEKVEWGDIDYMVGDMPPGSGDEVIALLELFKNKIDGTVIITTPSRIALTDVRKSVKLCQRMGVKIHGVVNNMSYYVCAKCGDEIRPFGSIKGIDELKSDFNVEVLADIPVLPQVEDNPFNVIKYYQPVADSIVKRKWF